MRKLETDGERLSPRWPVRTPSPVSVVSFILMTPRQGDPAEATPVRQPIGKLGQLQPDQRESDRHSEHHAEEHRRGRSARGEAGP